MIAMDDLNVISLEHAVNVFNNNGTGAIENKASLYAHVEKIIATTRVLTIDGRLDLLDVKMNNLVMNDTTKIS